MLMNIVRILVTIIIVILFATSIINTKHHKELMMKEVKNPTLLGQSILSNYKLDCIFEVLSIIILFLICITFKIF